MAPLGVKHVAPHGVKHVAPHGVKLVAPLGGEEKGSKNNYFLEEIEGWSPCTSRSCHLGTKYSISQVEALGSLLALGLRREPTRQNLLCQPSSCASRALLNNDRPGTPAGPKMVVKHVAPLG